MNKCYYRIVWENYPSDRTPLNEQNLNRIDVAVDETDNRIISLDAAKFDKSEAQLLVKYIEYDESTGIFKITHYNGASYEIDTLLEKLAINFDYDYQTQKLVITLSDGTVKYVDLSALITQYEFLESDTVRFAISPDGKVKADIIEGSIGEKHLRPDYLADIRVEAAKAEASKNAAAESEKNAASSAADASKSAANAAASATAAANSASNAKTSEVAAKLSQDNAYAAEDNANTYMQKASESAKNADLSAGRAQIAENSAAIAESSARSYASKSEAGAQSADSYSKMSQSYAVGTDGQVRPEDARDNSKFYSEQAQKLVDQAEKIIESVSAGALIPAGTVAFRDLPENPRTGYMYNISDAFTTDGRFAEGAGVNYNPGANVYWTAGGQWDVLAGVQVTGVKGNAETAYRHGDVNLTAENIGAFPAAKLLKEGNNLNAFITPGFYYKPGSVTVANWPPGTTKSMGMSLLVLKGGNTTYIQVARVNSASTKRGDTTYIRVILGSNVQNWIQQVNRIKGNAETEYRGGDVNLTAENVGAISKSGGSLDKDASLYLRGTSGISNKISISSDDGYETHIRPGEIVSPMFREGGVYLKDKYLQNIMGPNYAEHYFSNVFQDVGVDRVYVELFQCTINKNTYLYPFYFKIEFYTEDVWNTCASVVGCTSGLEIEFSYDTSFMTDSGLNIGYYKTDSGNARTFHVCAYIDYDAMVFAKVSVFGTDAELSTTWKQNAVPSSQKLDEEVRMSPGVLRTAEDIRVEGWINCAGSIVPRSAANTEGIGSPSLRWNAIYLKSSPSISSDREKKHDIAELESVRTRNFIMALKPSGFIYNDNTSGRTHYGFISQDVEEAMKSAGISSLDFAGFVKSPLKKCAGRNRETGENVEVPVLDEDGNQMFDYSLRYEEFIAPLTKMVQMHESEIKELQKEKSELEERLERIERLVGV